MKWLCGIPGKDDVNSGLLLYFFIFDDWKCLARSSLCLCRQFGRKAFFQSLYNSQTIILANHRNVRPVFFLSFRCVSVNMNRWQKKNAQLILGTFQMERAIIILSFWRSISCWILSSKHLSKWHCLFEYSRWRERLETNDYSETSKTFRFSILVRNESWYRSIDFIGHSRSIRQSES